MDSIFSPHLPFPSLPPRWIAMHRRDWHFHFWEVRRCHHAERSSYKTSLLLSPVENSFGFTPPVPFYFPLWKKHVATASNWKCTITRWGANSQTPGCQEQPRIKSTYLRRTVGSGTVGAERAHLFDGATEYLLQLNSRLSWKLMMPRISGLIRLSWKEGGTALPRQAELYQTVTDWTFLP